MVQTSASRAEALSQRIDPRRTLTSAPAVLHQPDGVRVLVGLAHDERHEQITLHPRPREHAGAQKVCRHDDVSVRDGRMTPRVTLLFTSRGASTGERESPRGLPPMGRAQPWGYHRTPRFGLKSESAAGGPGCAETPTETGLSATRPAGLRKARPVNQNAPRFREGVGNFPVNTVSNPLSCLLGALYFGSGLLTRI